MNQQSLSRNIATVTVRLKRPHGEQRLFIESSAKRKIIRAGRRSGKTTGIAILAVQAFLSGKRVLYTAPTQDQVARFWHEVKAALGDAIDSGVYQKNEVDHTIARPLTEPRIRAKTAWNADTLRGDYADLLIFDEYQLTSEDAWELVGAPMLLDNDGDAVFIYTPPSLRSRAISKARDKRHAAKMFKRAQLDETGRWAAFHFTSHANPHISRDALDEITSDMTSLAIRQEILAEDVEDVPGAIWTQALIDETRVQRAPDLVRVVVGVDPPGGATECGIVVAGISTDEHRYTIADYSICGTPEQWAGKAIDAFEDYGADCIVGEQNYGGDMVEQTIKSAAKARDVQIKYRHVHATRGKAVRAEPIQASFEQKRSHHVGNFPALEDEMTGWVPGTSGQSPNRLDAMVWAHYGLTRSRVIYTAA